MPMVNMLDAKTQLSRLVDAVESGAETEIVIARNGVPAARLVPVETRSATRRRLGFLNGHFPSMTLEEFNAHDAEIAALFLGKED